MPAAIASRRRVGEQRGRWAQCELAQSHIGLLPVGDCVSVHGFYSTFTALPVLFWSGFSCFCATLHGYAFLIFLSAFNISLASCQKVLAHRFAAICKRTSGYELICRNPPSTSSIYLHIFWTLTKKSVWLWHCSRVPRHRKRFLSFFLYLLTHIPSPALMASTCTVTHTLRATFSSRGFLPWCDYNSNAIVPLYVNVYYFSRYICSALLYSILFHPLHISIYIIELLIGLFSLPSALMQAAFEIQRLISVVRWCEANGHFFFFSPCWAFFLMWTRHTCRAQIKQIAYFDSMCN